MFWSSTQRSDPQDPKLFWPQLLPSVLPSTQTSFCFHPKLFPLTLAPAVLILSTPFCSDPQHLRLTAFYDVLLRGQFWVENDYKVPGRIRDGNVVRAKSDWDWRGNDGRFQKRRKLSFVSSDPQEPPCSRLNSSLVLTPINSLASTPPFFCTPTATSVLDRNSSLSTVPYPLPLFCTSLPLSLWLCFNTLGLC